MIRVSVEVGEDANRFDVTVLASSIEEALSIVRSRYPNVDPRIVHPIDPEAFFVSEPDASVLVEQLRVPVE